MTWVSAGLFFRNNVSGETRSWWWDVRCANVQEELACRELAAEPEAQIRPENTFSVFLETCAANFFFNFSISMFFCGLFLVIGFKDACHTMCACWLSDTWPLLVALQHVVVFNLCGIFYFSCLFLSIFLLSITVVVVCGIRCLWDLIVY